MTDPSQSQRVDEDHRSPLERIGEVIIVPLMLGIIAVGFAGVVMRFVFGGRYALFWTEEVIRYGFIWLFWLCAPILVWRGMMFSVDLLIHALPRVGQIALRLFFNMCILLLTGTYLYYGWSMAQVNSSQLSSALQLPLFWIYIAIPVGSLLIIGVTLYQTYQIITGRSAHGDRQ